jgi:hypothetical protein
MGLKNSCKPQVVLSVRARIILLVNFRTRRAFLALAVGLDGLRSVRHHPLSPSFVQDLTLDSARFAHMSASALEQHSQ